MEYWEFLLQKEGERSWQPLNSTKIDVESGRYRVVAHTSRNNMDVEICVTHTNTEEVPPKRRSQKRSRRTNPEGLMVVIPFTHLKPGLWELRCCGDIMSDFLGKSWQQAIQLQVLPKPTEVAPTNPQIILSSPKQPTAEVLGNLSENFTPNSAPKLAIPESEILAQYEKNGNTPEEVNSSLLTNQPEILVKHEINGNIPKEVNSSPLTEQPEILVENETNQDQPQPLPVTLVDVDPLFSPELSELDENQVLLNGDLTNGAGAANPILEQSLQMLEQILQQVLEPVMQELDPAESSESESSTEPEEIPVTSEQEMLLDEPGFILTLEEDAYTAQRGESLMIAGHVDILDVNQVDGGENVDANSFFRGSLRYQLRDPQTSQILLDVQKPLSEQPLPLAFSHSLEIPLDCKTRLILGKVTLSGSTPGALTSQPFTITADLDELLGAILPGTKIMPVAKMLVLANQFASLQDNQAALEELTEASLNPTVIDLIDTHSNPQPPPLQPALGKPIPPQIYQPTPTSKKSKSLNLPNFLKMSPATIVESKADQVKPEETLEQQESLVDDSALETQAEDITIESQLQEEVPQLKEKDGTLEPESSIVVVDSSLESSDTVNAADPFTPVIVSQPDDLETIELWDTPEPQIPPTEVQATSATTQELQALDDAFPTLNIQDRFWSRLNSLAADAELSQLLKSEISSPPNPSEVKDGMVQLDSHPLLAEVEEVTQSLNSDQLITDFDESIWEQTEKFNGNSTDTAQQEELQPPAISENPPTQEKAPLQLPQVGVRNTTDWAAQEIVVEEEEEEPPAVEESIVQPDASQERQPIKPLVSTKLELILPSTVHLESPLPAPTICVPTAELTAGEPITVRVKLPPHSARLCVKLWVQDRQSRYLLDGPRWLVDLLPDGAGQLEAMTQVVIPFGSAQIRLEAIALDLDSQRESHKVTVDCVVVPPDFPGMSLDEFEV